MNAIFNWYREEVDYKFANPVTKKHRTLGIIRKDPPKNKKLNHGELKLFSHELKQERPLWYDFALTQLLCAGRVSSDN